MSENSGENSIFVKIHAKTYTFETHEKGNLP